VIEMKYIYESSMILAKAANGNPVVSTVTVMLFYLIFNTIEANIEALLFGERFEHWADVVFQLAFIAYAALSVCTCAIHNADSAV
jgi:hypothetical protein